MILQKLRKYKRAFGEFHRYLIDLVNIGKIKNVTTYLNINNDYLVYGYILSFMQEKYGVTPIISTNNIILILDKNYFNSFGIVLKYKELNVIYHNRAYDNYQDNINELIEQFFKILNYNLI
jgi:hypothetical protein